MRGGEGYDKFLKNIKNKLFKYRFDRASPEKKRGITLDEAKHLIKVFLSGQNTGQLTSRQIEKLANAEINRLKQTLVQLERSPTYKYLPILRKKRKSPRRTIKRQGSLQARKHRYFDEKRYYMTRFKKTNKSKTKKSKTKRSLHHSLSLSEKWGTV
jgi:hypothetical protein